MKENLDLVFGRSPVENLVPAQSAATEVAEEPSAQRARVAAIVDLDFEVDEHALEDLDYDNMEDSEDITEEELTEAKEKK